MYLIDSNVLIQAKNLHYEFDICPGYWNWLDIAHADQRVSSVERVGNELAAGNDQLTTWAAARSSFFVAPDHAVVNSLALVSQWVVSQTFAQAAISEFLSVADYYLIAQAHAHGHVVVSHEKFDANIRKKVKIPNVCKGLGVRCISNFEMLKMENAQFVLMT